MANEPQYLCPCCQGAKVQHVTGAEVTVAGTRQLPPVDIPCIWCAGQGEGATSRITLDSSSGLDGGGVNRGTRICTSG